MLRDGAVLPAPAHDPKPDIYRLAPARPLPSFDPRPTVKSRVLSHRALQIYNRAVRKLLFLLFPAYWIGFILRGVAFFSPADVRTAVSTASVVLQFPMILNTFMNMRTEIIKVLLRSFEFAFLSVMVLLWIVAIGMAMGLTVRLFILPITWIEITNGFMLEASPHSHAHGPTAIAATSCAAFLTMLMVGVGLDLITDVKYLEIASTPSHSITTAGVLLNAMGTIVMYFLRLTYCSIQSLRNRRKRATGTAVESRIYRCTLEWKPAKEGLGIVAVCPVATFPISKLSDPARLDDQLFLTFVPSTKLFDASNTVIPWLSPPPTNRARRLRHLMGVLSSTTIVVNLITPGPTPAAAITSIVAITATSIYAIVIVSCYQRQLLRKICTSFNFVFMSVQLTAAHICLCDVFYWQQHKALAILAAWIWMHLILTADALTPATKTRLRFKLWFIAPVIALALAGQVMLMLELVWMDRWHLQNRVIWEFAVVAGHRVTFNASSVLLSRLVTLVVWFLRLLYRVWNRLSEDELVLLQGTVEFDYVAWRQRSLKSLRALDARAKVPTRTAS